MSRVISDATKLEAANKRIAELEEELRLANEKVVQLSAQRDVGGSKPAWASDLDRADADYF